MTRVTKHESRETTSPEAAWSVAEAKANLSAVIERARSVGPQTITRHGRPAVVVVSVDEWQQKDQQEGTLADFFAASPLRDAPDLIIERIQQLPRDVDL